MYVSCLCVVCVHEYTAATYNDTFRRCLMKGDMFYYPPYTLQGMFAQETATAVTDILNHQDLCTHAPTHTIPTTTWYLLLSNPDPSAIFITGGAEKSSNALRHFKFLCHGR